MELKSSTLFLKLNESSRAKRNSHEARCPQWGHLVSPYFKVRHEIITDSQSDFQHRTQLPGSNLIMSKLKHTVYMLNLSWQFKHTVCQLV